MKFRLCTFQLGSRAIFLVFLFSGFLYIFYFAPISISDLLGIRISYQNGDDDEITIRTVSASVASGRRAYVVNTSTCQIPDLDPWDADVRQLRKKCKPSDEEDPKCGQRQVRRWMYAQGSDLIVNYTAIKEAGYSPGSLYCCYRVVQRVEQSPDNYDMDADNVIKYSDECHRIPIYEISRINSEFIRVFCISLSWPLLLDVVYRELFAIPQPDSNAFKKISKWKSLRVSAHSHPSVILLGIDTNSRLNSHRRLPQSLKVLQQLGAVEFFGHTKNGENTFPNSLAFLSGLREQQFSCQKTSNLSMDDCPFIWKDFDRAGYLTSTCEDAPYASSFNFMRAGFVKKPTDFYYRPFTLAAMKQPRENYWLGGKCIGGRSAVEILLTYMRDTIRWASSGAPVFIHTWLDIYSHGCINTVRFMDHDISRWIQSLESLNTILFFMSDHGDRYGPFRDTTLGWYEDKLPSLWVYLPPSIRKRFPEWQQALEINSRRLTSHFDLYHTLVQILETFKLEPSFTVKTTDKLIGQSLLRLVPENRTCELVGVPSSYCACTEPRKIDVGSGDPVIQKKLNGAVNTALGFLNKNLPQQCARPTLKKLVAGKMVAGKGTKEAYILSIITNPGDFLFEVTVNVQETGNNRTLVVESWSDILRMNKIMRRVDCVTNPALITYCYCL